MIKRVDLPGLLIDIEGMRPVNEVKDLISGLFEYEGFEYYVQPSGRFNNWFVFKVAGDGHAIAGYDVKKEKHGLTCDCHAGRKHLACRHKEMVQMFGSNRIEGSCGSNPQTKRSKGAGLSRRPVANQQHNIRQNDLDPLLKRIELLLGGTNAR